MTDRLYLRTNFSSATAPGSSGARSKDAFGDEYARIPLQLPGNLMDQTDQPRAIDMMLTKLSIPLGRVPVMQIPLENIDEYTFDIHPIPPIPPPAAKAARTSTRTSPTAQASAAASSGLTHLDAKACCTVWPFRVNKYGGITLRYYNNAFFDPLTASQTGMTQWPITRMRVPVNEVRGSPEYIQKIQLFKRTKSAFLQNVEEITTFLSDNFTAALFNVLESRYPNQLEIIDKYVMDFHVENSRLIFRLRKHGNSREIMIPFTDDYFDEAGESRYPPPLCHYTTNANGVITQMNEDTLQGFSFVGNSYLRDLFPGLPWIRIPQKSLIEFDPTTGNGQTIWGWDEFCDPSDTDIYVLDTTGMTFSWAEEELYQDSDNSLVIHSKPATYKMDSLNLISLVPVSAFVVMINGLTITPQTYPVNINPANVSSAQITSVPIIEVYYPLWDSIDDLSTSMIVSKDAFTNAAPFVLTPDSLRERNLTFEVYYITTDGAMHILTIPPGTAINLQICYAVKY